MLSMCLRNMSSETEEKEERHSTNDTMRRAVVCQYYTAPHQEGT